jgi:hypothetical protein
MMVCIDLLSDFLIKPLSFKNAYVDTNAARKRVGDINTRRFSWHWPVDNESIIPMVSSIVNMTFSSVSNAAIPSLPGCRQKL